ncbi:MAG: ATP-dependent Clp protease proteolytic subunit [Vicinamibacterales bacterium]
MSVSPDGKSCATDGWGMTDISDRLLSEIVDAVKEIVRKEQSDRLRDIYLIGDIDKDSARHTIERLRELANDSAKPITLYINSAGGNVTDGLALHDAIAQLVNGGVTITIVVQGMAYSMGSVVVQAASPGRRWCFPHAWMMIHEPAKWAGWQSTTAAAQHLDRLKQMQDQIYRIMADRSGKPLRQIIRDTKRTDLYLDSAHSKRYGLVDEIIGVTIRIKDGEPVPIIPAPVTTPPSLDPEDQAEAAAGADPAAEQAAAHHPTPAPPAVGTPDGQN